MAKKRDEQVSSSRARAAILRSFGALIQVNRYDLITVKHIVERARVARSTFYANFLNKDEVLLEGLAEPFRALARTVAANCEAPELREVLQHFWDNQRIANPLLSGPMRRPATQLLAGLIEEELRACFGSDGLRLPVPLVAKSIAGGQPTLIHAWLSGEAPSSATELAPALAALGHNAGLSVAAKRKA